MQNDLKWIPIKEAELKPNVYYALLFEMECYTGEWLPKCNQWHIVGETISRSKFYFPKAVIELPKKANGISSNVVAPESKESQYEKSIAIMKRFVNETPPNEIAELIVKFKSKDEPAIDAVNLDWLNDSLLNKLAVDRYGCDPNLFGQQRDGFTVGYKEGYTAALYVNKQPEKEVDSVLLQKALDYLHSNITASIVYEDFQDFSKGIKGAEVDYFPETVAELLIEMGVLQTKSTHVPIEEYNRLRSAIEQGLADLKSERSYPACFKTLTEALIKPQ